MNNSLATLNPLKIDETAGEVKIPEFLKLEKLESLNKQLIIVALVGLRPVLKDDVPDVLFMANGAGVKIRALTGDSAQTIKGLCLQSGLLTHDEISDPYVCMTGEELEKVLKKNKEDG